MEQKYWDAIDLSLESEEAFKARLKEMSSLELAEFYMGITEDARYEAFDNPELPAAILRDIPDYEQYGEEGDDEERLALGIVAMGKAFWDQVRRDPYSVNYAEIPSEHLISEIWSEYDRRGEELPIYDAIETKENAFFRKKGVTVQVPRRFERDPWREEVAPKAWRTGRIQPGGSS